MLSNISTYKTIGIFGMGREGIALKTFLPTICPNATLVEIGEENIADLHRCDIVFKSPGVSLYRPEIQSLIQSGIPVTSSTNLFMHLKKPTQKIIAVTGTKGKSTTSSLLYHTLKQLGISVGFGGNIGVPLIDLLSQNVEWIVAELSSYQCADFMGNVDVGLLLNLYPEHLQWHETHERYYADKIKMIRQSNCQIVNALDPKTKDYLPDLNPVFFNHENGIHVQNGFFMNGAEALFPITSLHLIGYHNALNACAVLTVIHQMGLDVRACESAFQTFQSLPHRLQQVGQMNGITFIDDSISTTPETAIAGLSSFPSDRSITLIAGGQDRGQDFTELVAYLSKHKNRIQLITLPDTGKRLFELAQRAGIPSFYVDTMQQAVQLSKNITPNDGIVLLSPAAPSYNLYKNFEERGADFKKHAMNEG